MGIDIGSVSTNLVVVDDEGRVIKEIYTKTDARPVEVVTKGLTDIHDEIGARINLLGVGTTGSGRELIGELCGADIITDEITAHKTGADFIGRQIGRQVDTIFEIGGQDSKFISLQDGIVVDFAMNEACAAGTGSFLEEQAEKLGINIIDEFAQLALSSPAPIRLGERCTVFMERDVMAYQQRGARREDLVAGLAFSIANNYLNRLVRERTVGDCIFFQGGTAYNDAVAAAFSQILGKEIIVPPYNGVIGALGMALLARERAQRTGEPSTFRGWDLGEVDYTVVDFVCKACSNECDVRQFTIEGEKTYWGDKCSDRYRKPAKVDKQPVIDDLVAFREERLLAPYEAARERVAERRPRSASRAACTPTTGCRSGRRSSPSSACVRCSRRRATSRSARPASTSRSPSRASPSASPTATCSGSLREGVDCIFLPNQVNEETEFTQFNSHACPWGQTLPFVVRTAPGLEEHRDKLLCPRVMFRDGREGLVRDMAGMAAQLGVSKARLRAALDRAYVAQDEFREALLGAGREALDDAARSRRARHRPRRPPVQHVRQGHQHGHPAQAAQVLRGQRDPARLPAHQGHRHQPHRAQHVLELRAQDPAGGELRARPGAPAPHLHDQLQVRPRLVHQALRARGVGQAVPHAAVRRAPERRRGDDALRGLPRQQGLPALVVAGRRRARARLRADAGGGRCRRVATELVQDDQIKRAIKDFGLEGRRLYLPQMPYGGSYLLAAAIRSIGFDAWVTSDSDERTLELGGRVTSGDECYPQKITIGDFLRIIEDEGRDKVAFLMPTANGPCRFGQYLHLIRSKFDELGYDDVPVITITSSDGYSSIGSYSSDLIRTAWRAVLTQDILMKLLLKTRPYETEKGSRRRGLPAEPRRGRRGRQPQWRLAQGAPGGHRCRPIVRARDRFRAVPGRATTARGRSSAWSARSSAARTPSPTSTSSAWSRSRAASAGWPTSASGCGTPTTSSAAGSSTRGGASPRTTPYRFLKSKVMRRDEHALYGPFADDFVGYEEPDDVREVLELSFPYLPYTGALGEMVLSSGKAIYLYEQGRRRHHRHQPVHLHERHRHRGRLPEPAEGPRQHADPHLLLRRHPGRPGARRRHLHRARAHLSAAQEEAAPLPGVLLGSGRSGSSRSPTASRKGLPLDPSASRGRAREREALRRTVAAGGSRVRVGEWSAELRSCGLASRSSCVYTRMWPRASPEGVPMTPPVPAKKRPIERNTRFCMVPTVSLLSVRRTGRCRSGPDS